MDVEETKAAILKAEQAIILMDSRLQHKLRPEHKRALANAILRSGAQDDLVFHHQTVRKTPGWWTLGGLLARIRLVWDVKVRKQTIADEAEQLADWAAHIRRSGARRLLIATLIGLICGLINFGLPAELALQALRDKTRPINASGEIVVIAKDEFSRKAFGELPWSRKYDAMLLDRLREMGAKRIVFNEAFDREMDPVGDGQFTKALERARGKVWLGAYYDIDQRSGRQIDFFPHPKFKMECCVAHSHLKRNPFYYVDKFSLYEQINRHQMPSVSLMLSGQIPERRNDVVKIDSAIRADSITILSAYDLMKGQFGRNRINDKIVLVSSIARTDNDDVALLGQGQQPTALARVLAAETIKNGSATALGWMPTLLAAILIVFVSVLSRNPHRRLRLALGGIIVIMSMAFVGDRVGIHVELVPALATLIIFSLRDRFNWKLLKSEFSNPISGLPSLSELSFARDREKKFVGALKVERYQMHLNLIDVEHQREFVRSIAARINIIFPDNVIHQGEDGVFAWLIDPDSEYQPVSFIAQLTALFRLPIGAIDGPHDVGIAVGFSSDLNESFAARLAVATDRARVSLFGTLTSVQ